MPGQPQLKPWPDSEQVMLVGLTPLVQAVYSTVRFCTTLPENITTPTVRIKRISGAQRDITTDRPILDVDTFWSDYGIASAVARQVTASLLSLRGLQLMNGVIANVNVVQGPRWMPEPDPNLYRFNATYEAFVHG
jgi:hypothetical protein